MSKLYFRHGAMNSGKSTALLQAAYNYEERGQAVLLAKPAVVPREIWLSCPGLELTEWLIS